ncbi:MAG: GNAT family N-acetyltransferase [Bellilinea sp.]
MFTTQLFVSQSLVLDPYDPEKDATMEAGFTRRWNYIWGSLLYSESHPLSSFQVKKKREEQLKRCAESRDSFLFAIRLREDGRFIGVVELPWVSWSNRLAWMKVLIGEESLEVKYLREAARMGLRYAFEELDMALVASSTGEFQPQVLHTLESLGMQVCVRQRQMVYFQSRYWDRLVVGISQSDWQTNNWED